METTMNSQMSLSELNERIQEQTAWIDLLKTEIGKVVIGNKTIVDRLLIGLLSNGHILLEGMPGLAKTLLIKTLAQLFQLKFQRIQFTPDLLPADIVGTLIYNPHQGQFTTKKGPIFTNILLADEINRSPAKVQSALLEGMQERQVTLGDTTYPLENPFLVLATQNPVEQEGTYPLPEAQLDRFMLKITTQYPSWQEERMILDAKTSTQPSEEVRGFLAQQVILESRQWIDKIYMDDKIRDYIVHIIYATRTPEKYHLSINNLIRYGASPRGTIALALAAKTSAFLKHRGYVIPQDVKSIAPDVLRHRIGLTYEAEAEEISSDQVIANILETVPVP
ncbi:MAG: MoxR family ATPase [Puniceicoccales bacterium]|jgi:MoxR-like ATPase|nr:MoxR family ATPase [Puniceicoccales bacterium]